MLLQSLFNLTIWDEYFPGSGHTCNLPLLFKTNPTSIVTTRKPNTLHEIVNYSVPAKKEKQIRFNDYGEVLERKEYVN